MFFAKDRLSGNELSAAKAVASAYYVCPVCGEDVFLRAGTIRVPHFAHRSGRASLDCENYHPGVAIRNPLPLQYQNWPASDRGSHIVPLTLGLLVEPATVRSRKDLRRWRLVLTLPRSPTAAGRMRIATGFGTTVREVPLSRLVQGPQEIEVSPNASHFGPEWVSDELDYGYRQIVSRRLDGFSPESAQAFAASAARFKPRSSSLEWGENYYVIWKRMDFKIPEAVIAQPMATYEGWSAALVTLPPAPTDEITHWIEKAFGLRAHQAGRHWGILLPPPIDIDVDGNVLVSNTQSVLLAFGATADSGAATILSITSGTAQGAVSLIPGADTLVQVTPQGDSSSNGLTLQWGPKQLPSIVAAETSKPIIPSPAIMLELHDSKLGTDRRSVLHLPEGRHALDCVRNGRAELTSLSLPHSVQGVLERRAPGGNWQPVLVLKEAQKPSRGAAWFPSAQRLRAITDALRDLHTDVRLAFGVFGHYVAFALRASVATHQSLSSDTKRRILWYCRANGVSHRAARLPVEQCSDDELLELFRYQPPRAHLIAHRNLLERKLLIEHHESSER